jgi:sporulation protein YlmC with PRC-barrel domain
MIIAAMIVFGIFATGVARAQESYCFALEAQAHSRMQVAAAALSRSLVSRPVFVATGERVGRISNVVVGPDGNSTVAIVTVRPRFGWGQIVVPVQLLRQRQGRLLISDTLDGVRAMPRVQRGAAPKR